MFNVPLEEQETIIHFMRNDKHATIYTTDSTTKTKLDKLCEAAPDYYKPIKVDYIKGEACGVLYELADKSMVSLRKGKKTFTDEELQRLRDRAKANLKK